jgi:hypothetical protein
MREIYLFKYFFVWKQLYYLFLALYKFFLNDELLLGSSRVMHGLDLAECVLERLKANVEVATVLCSIPASPDTVESEGRQMKQC